jgi:hypothetical protein
VYVNPNCAAPPAGLAVCPLQLPSVRPSQLLTSQLPVLAGSGGGLSGEKGVRSCEMAGADELEPRDPLLRVELREPAL